MSTTNLPPVLAIFCSAADPWTGHLCRRLASDCRADEGIGQHSRTVPTRGPTPLPPQQRRTEPMIRVHLMASDARDFDTADGFAYDDTGFLDIKTSGSILATFAPGVWVSAELVVPAASPDSKADQ